MYNFGNIAGHFYYTRIISSDRIIIRKNHDIYHSLSMYLPKHLRVILGKKKKLARRFYRLFQLAKRFARASEISREIVFHRLLSDVVKSTGKSTRRQSTRRHFYLVIAASNCER